MSQQVTRHHTSAKRAASPQNPNETGRRRAGLIGMSLRARVSLLVMAAVGVTVLAAAIVSYMTIRVAVTNRLDANLSQKANQLLA
ncbi:MAG TPA: hypothetical protein VGM10_23335, partial [Actinocrinis sp.]